MENLKLNINANKHINRAKEYNRNIFILINFLRTEKKNIVGLNITQFIEKLKSDLNVLNFNKNKRKEEDNYFLRLNNFSINLHLKITTAKEIITEDFLADAIKELETTIKKQEDRIKRLEVFTI